MTTLDLFILSIIQGVTEFLPISSQAHLMVGERLLGLDSNSLRSVEVALHVGTLGAVLVYFRLLLWQMIRGAIPQILRKKEWSWEGRLSLILGVATLPAVGVGFMVHKFFPSESRSFWLVGSMSILFGVLLYAADRWGRGQTRLERVGWKQGIVVGVGQAFALIPGASRSGATITAARAVGMERVGAAEFSFLLSIPVVIGALVLTVPDQHLSVTEWVIGAGTSFIFGLGMIAGLLKFLGRGTFFPFMVYRVLFGLGMIILC